MNESWHGTPNGYVNHNCRCDLCRKANTNWHHDKRRERSLPDGDVRHGTVNGYKNYMCRCDLCREAQRQSMALYRARLIL